MQDSESGTSHTPHIRVGTDEQPADWDLDVYLDGERMDFRDGYAEGAVELESEFQDGILVVRVGYQNGMAVWATHMDEDRWEEIAAIDCVFGHEEDDSKTWLADDERYDFEIELRKIYGEYQ